MKHLKILGLLAVSAAAMLAFTGTASATSTTSPQGTVYTSTIKASSESGHLRLVGPLGINSQCSSAFEGKVAAHGAGLTVSATITALTFTGCTNGYTVQVINGNFGSLEVHATGSGNATVTSKNTEFTLTSPLGFNCIYRTAAAGTDLGTLTGSSTTKSTATLEINGAVVPQTGHSAFCGASAEWTSSYLINTPDFLDIDA